MSTGLEDVPTAATLQGETLSSEETFCYTAKDDQLDGTETLVCEELCREL